MLWRIRSWTTPKVPSISGNAACRTSLRFLPPAAGKQLLLDRYGEKLIVKVAPGGSGTFFRSESSEPEPDCCYFRNRMQPTGAAHVLQRTAPVPEKGRISV